MSAGTSSTGAIDWLSESVSSSLESSNTSSGISFAGGECASLSSPSADETLSTSRDRNESAQC